MMNSSFVLLPTPNSLGLEWASGGGPEALAFPDSTNLPLNVCGGLTRSFHFSGLQFPFMQNVCKTSPHHGAVVKGKQAKLVRHLAQADEIAISES